MDELFGAPMSAVAAAFGVLFAIGCGALLFILIRNPILVRMAARNVPRRRAQSILIVAGLMLATVIISSAFTTGDSVAFSIDRSATDSLRSLDMLVRVDDDSPVWKGKAAPDEFPERLFAEIGPALEADPKVESVVPALVENVAVVNFRTRQFEVNGLLTGLDPARAATFDRLVTTGGQRVDLASLAPGEAYLDDKGAKRLGAVEGDVLQVPVAPGRVVELRVKAIVSGWYFKRAETDAVLMTPLAWAQEALGRPGLLSVILVSNRGGYSDAVGLSAGIERRHQDLPAIRENGLELFPLKQEIVDTANEIASVFVTFFTTFGLFSIGVGILLIFLIFSMLAAERKSELGMARAVGMRRAHLVQMFVAEGALYSFGAAIIGALAGIGVGFLLVYGVGEAFARSAPDEDFRLSPHVSAASLLVSLFAGSVVTLITVAFASWRVSRLNIVRAVRDIPEPQTPRAGRRTLVWGIILTLLGVLLAGYGFAADQLTVFGLGLSLAPIGLALVLRYAGAPQRWVLTAVGVFLLAYWLAPQSLFDKINDAWKQDFSIFFVAGALVTTGGVLVTVNNSPVILGLVMRTAGRVQRLAPMVKSAVSYPLRSGFRTGMSMAMFAAVIFSIIVMASLNVSFDKIFDDQQRLTGGYDVIAQSVADINPVDDTGKLIESNAELAFVTRVDGKPSVGTLRTVLDARGRLATTPVGDEQDTLVSGVDDDFVASNRFAITLATPEFGAKNKVDSAAVWRALRDRPGAAVVSALLVPSRNNFNFGGNGDRFHLNPPGLSIENKSMDPVPISVVDPKSGATMELTVIGVVDDVASFFFLPFSIFTSTRTLDAQIPRRVNATRLFFHVQPGTKDAAMRIEGALFDHGMETVDLKDTIGDVRSTRRALLDLLTAFMALGLVVGIAALGVISARAVVERRHQIGVLRAIGFSRRMVAVSFLMESSFIALVGIGLGLVTGLITSVNVVADVRPDEPNVELIIPWGRIAIIVVGAYLFSLVTTVLPARQASRVAPADALRYE